MGVLRDRMVREMSLREFSAFTQKLYLATLTDLAKYPHRSPDILDPTQVRRSNCSLSHPRSLERDPGHEPRFTSQCIVPSRYTSGLAKCMSVVRIPSFVSQSDGGSEIHFGT